MEKGGEPPPAYAGQAPGYPSPGGQVPPYPQSVGYAPGQPITQQPTVVTTVMVTPTIWSPYPVQMQCPNCHAHVTTETIPINGLLVWLVCIGLCLIGCGLGCCLIPFCIDDLKDIEHRCPQCRAYLGVKKRL